MRRKAWAVLAVGVLAGAASGCDAVNKILGGGNTYDDHSIDIEIHPPGASPSPSPSPTATPLPGGITVRSVFNSMFGEECPAGIIPVNERRAIRKGCTAHLTCTAILSDGRDAVDVFPNAVPEKYDLVDPNASPKVVTLQGAGNPWNRDAVGTNAGTAEIFCAFGGLDSRASDGPWILTVKN